MKIVRIEQDGYVWHVPVKIIAENRAEFYADDTDSDYDTELEYAMNEPSEVIDWLMNNMNWEDIRAYATLVAIPKPKESIDFGEEFDIEIEETAE